MHYRNVYCIYRVLYSVTQSPLVLVLCLPLRAVHVCWSVQSFHVDSRPSIYCPDVMYSMDSVCSAVFRVRPSRSLCGKSYRYPALVTRLPSAGTWYSPGASTGDDHQYQAQVHHRYRLRVTGLHGPCACASLSKAKKHMLPTFRCTYLN